MKSVNKVINIMVKNWHKVSKFESKLADEKKHFSRYPLRKAFRLSKIILLF